MAFFSSLKNSLKQKWLQYFQSNRFWISLHVSGAVATPDGGKRPASYLILGVINALEPELAELMLPFSTLNPNVEALIDVLGLNFDPDLMLGNNSQTAIEVQENQQVQVNDVLGNDLEAIASNDESVVVINEAASLGSGSSVPKAFQERDALTVTSLDEIDEETLDNNSVVVNSSDEFSDVFLDTGNKAMHEFELTSNSESVTEDERQSQDAQDISRLFPNF